MERKEGRKDQLPVDPRRELERCGKGNTLFDMELQAYKRLFTDDDNMDESYKILLTALFSKQNKIIMSQKMKPGDNPDLPLFPIMKFKRPEQFLRRETGRVLIQNDKDAVAFKERCKLSNKKRVGFEMPKKQKGKGLLIHYVDVDVHEVVGKGCKKQNGKEHLVEPGDVRKDSEKTIFEPHKRDSEHRLISENDEVREKELELEKKRKGKGPLVEPDDCDVGENDAEALKERLKQSDRYNVVCENSGKTSKEILGTASKEISGTASKERSELDRERKGKDHVIEQDSGYEIFLKLMEEYNQNKNEAISKNVVTDKTEEGIGSNKDKEPEPKRVTTRVLEPDFEIPNKVPNLVKKPNVEKSRTDEKVQAELEKRSSHRSGNGGDDKNAEIEKLLARKSKKVVFKEYSNEKDKEEREEIEKSPSREFGNFAMEKSKSKRVDSDIEKLSSRRSGKVADEGVGIKKCPAYQSRDEYKREEIEKNSSEQFRNVIMQKSKNDKARADISKSSSRCSMIFIDKEYSSVDEDENVRIEKRPAACRSRKDISDEQGKKDERVEIEKHSSHEFRNVITKKLKKQNAEPDFVQRSCRQSRKVVYKDYSSHEDEDENADLRIKKRPAPQSREAVMDNSSDNGNTEIKKHSSHKFRKPKEDKLTTEMDKRAAREYRKVVMKRPRGEEDVEEEVKRFRDFLLMRSRYEVEEDNMKNRVGESSVRHNKINEDSSEEDEKSSDKDSDVEILSIDESLKGPFVPSTTFRNTDVRNYRLSDEYIEFRRQALEVISKPYDKSEYKDLFAEFKGRCYPGYHQDLVEKLKENRWNPRKRLAILRGFFFWLQNLTRVGSFKPWHDDVCLRVEPVRLPKNNGPW